MNAAPILIRIFTASAIAVAGGVLSAWLARTHKQLCAFISLGAGTLLGVAVFGIVPECLEALHGWLFLLAGASGYFLFAFITKYIYHVCPACVASHFDEATTHRLAEFATAMMFALGIHCTVDGLALAAVESMTVVGGLLGWFVLRNASDFWLALALANAAGGFLYLAIHAVLGELFKHHKGLVLGYFAAGFGVVSALIFFFHLKA